MVELLAPGGSVEGLKAAVNAGADAVYMGGVRFGARAYAQNPEEKELLDAVDYCHIHGKKLYLTVNTLLKERELERELYSYVLPLYEHGLDAVLVQDLGVFRFLRRNFPDLPLHASTQMTISSVEGARLLKEMGAERVVLSRELSLDEIRTINSEVDIETECFVHGALCCCYSGQCLMSSMIGGRSGNRGRCAQPCRLPYELYGVSGRVSNPKTPYLLSLKDICVLELLPELIESGVCSYKIEGRMKRSEYAAGVTAIYRKYLDLYSACGREQYRVDPEDERILMDLYNRGGFSKGYYSVYNGKNMMAMGRPNHQGTAAARVLESRNGQVRLQALEQLHREDALEMGDIPGNTGKEWTLKEDVPKGKAFTVSENPRRLAKGQILHRVRSEYLLQELRDRYIKREKQEKIKGKFILRVGKPAILKVEWNHFSAEAAGDTVSPALSRPLTSETVIRQLSKTGNTPFVFAQLEPEMDETIFLPLQSLNELRREALAALEESVLRKGRRRLSAGISGEADGGKMEEDLAGYEEIGEIPGEAKKCETNGFTGQTLPELRASVETFEQFFALLEEPEIRVVYLDCAMFLQPRREGTDGPGALTFRQAVDTLHEIGKEGYLTMPAVWRKPIREAFERVFSEPLLECADGFLLRSADQISYLVRYVHRKKMAADSSIYTFNREARAFLRDRGLERDTVPLELNLRELRERGCAGSECIVYGYIPLMVTAQCPVKNTSGCEKKPQLRYLRDRKNISFPVRNRCCFCTNIIYNSVPLELLSCTGELGAIGAASWRLAFTVEDSRAVRETVRAAVLARKGEPADHLHVSKGTRGHFKRGVE